jgi:hygromycin-B 4-O-kinase
MALAFDLESAHSLLEQAVSDEVQQFSYLGAGMFSQAFAFSTVERDYVFRLNPFREDFEKDRFAHQHYSSGQLPIPEVLQIGEAEPGVYYAITPRFPGQIFSDWSPAVQRVLAEDMFQKLDAIHAIDVAHWPGWGRVTPGREGRFGSWEAALLSLHNQKFAFNFDRFRRLPYWEQSLWDSYYAELARLVRFAAPEKYLVHGDFGFDNLLATAEGVTGVLDWAEMSLGDYLYDVAFLAYWSDEMALGDLWLRSGRGCSADNLDERMRCYLIHQGLSALLINAQLGQETYFRSNLKRLARWSEPGRWEPQCLSE